MIDPRNSPPPPPEEHEWERGFEGHELAQLRRRAKLSFREKLQWLEEAHRLVRQLEEERKSAERKRP